jgi:hypothetical protein
MLSSNDILDFFSLIGYHDIAIIAM